MPSTVAVRPLTKTRLADLRGLFASTKTTQGCYCTWFLRPSKECHAGWGAANQAAFEGLAAQERHPMGLLAYRAGEAVGWCAAGPRSRYVRALRSPVLRERDPRQDEQVWLVPCFYVRRDARRLGVTRLLLEAAVRAAERAGAPAIEGFPLAGDRRRSAAEAYLGVQPLFAAAGFSPVAHPTAGRVVMRRELR